MVVLRSLWLFLQFWREGQHGGSPVFVRKKWHAVKFLSFQLEIAINLKD
jgi:hypothetical protein